MTKIVETIINKDFTTAKNLVNEKLQSIAERKMQEVKKMIEQGQQAAQNKRPTPEDQQRLSVAEFNQTKTQQIGMELSGQDAESQMDYMSLAIGNPKVYS